MKILFTFFALLTLSSTTSFSQQAAATMELNNIKCSVTSTGDLFYTPGSDYGTFEAPNGSGLKTMYAGNLWFGGISSDQQLKLAAETYQATGQDWFTGPLTTDGTASTTDEIEDAYNQVWQVTFEDVSLHIAYFEALSNGTVEVVFPDGYSIPDVFFTWPAHGDLNAEMDFSLAPFFDYNVNGFYDPENGDYPIFCGSECIYFIFNDKANVHSESGGQPIGLEIHGMLYGFESSDNTMLQNTVFLKYKIINRGTQTLENTFAGMWTDLDIGTAIDDYVGTNVKRSALFGYNGDSIDEQSSSSNGYGEDLPMQGVMILGGPFADSDNTDNPLPDDLYSSETQSYGSMGYGYGDGIIDNERLGLSTSLYYQNSSHLIYGEPNTAIHYHNFMRSIWKNGQNQTYQGDLIDASAYSFPGSSDPLNLSTGVVQEEIWDELTSENLPGDRRVLGSCGPFTLEPGDIHYLDVAYVFAQESQAGGEPLADFFDNRLKEARLFFNDNLIDCQEQGSSVGIIEESNASNQFTVYPNPAQAAITIDIKTKTTIAIAFITDLSGKIIKTFNLNRGINTISIEELSAGIYFLHAEASCVKLIKG